MKELRDIKIDILTGSQNPVIDLFNQITDGTEIINCDVDKLDKIKRYPKKDLKKYADGEAIHQHLLEKWEKHLPLLK